MPVPPCLGGSSYSACAGAVLFLPRPEPVDSGWSADVRLARTWPLAHCVSVSPFAPSAASDDVRYSAATGGQAACPDPSTRLRVHGPSLPSARTTQSSRSDAQAKPSSAQSKPISRNPLQTWLGFDRGPHDEISRCDFGCTLRHPHGLEASRR